MRRGFPRRIGLSGLALSCRTTGRSSSATTGSLGSWGRAYSSSTSFIRSTNGVSIFGTHHIFFPPGLDVLVGEGSSYGLLADRANDLSPFGFIGDQGDGPSRPPLGWRTAHHRDERGGLRAVEKLGAAPPGLLAQRMLDAALQKAVGYTPHLA